MAINIRKSPFYMMTGVTVSAVQRWGDVAYANGTSRDTTMCSLMVSPTFTASYMKGFSEIYTFIIVEFLHLLRYEHLWIRETIAIH